MILADESRQLSEITAFARYRDDPLHRPANHHHLLAVSDPRFGGSAKTRDIGCESRDDDAAGRAADQLGEARGDIGFGRALSFAKHVRRVADEGENALVAE